MLFIVTCMCFLVKADYWLQRSVEPVNMWFIKYAVRKELWNTQIGHLVYYDVPLMWCTLR